MELWQLRTFSAVAKHLHFTRASEELNLSQPAVSHQIKALEKELGEKLFIRNRNDVRLTREGQIVFSYANKILDITDEMKGEIEESKDSLSGEIKIGAVLDSMNNPFPFLYEEFKKKYKDIELRFQSENTSEDIVERVKSGDLDVGLAVIKTDSEDIIEVPYGRYENLFVVGPDHHLADREEVTPAEIENEKWTLLYPDRRLRKLIDQKFSEAGISPKNIYETHDGSVIRGLVALGEKVSILPTWGIVQDLQRGFLRPVRVPGLEFATQTYLTWKANRQSKIMSAVITFLLEQKLPGIELNKTSDEQK